MTDRRAGPKQGPYVGKEPRSRTQGGQWRQKRSDAGSSRGGGASGCGLPLLTFGLLVTGSLYALSRAALRVFS